MRNGKAAEQNFPKNPHYFSPQLLTKSHFLLHFAFYVNWISKPVEIDQFNRVGFEAVRRFDPVL